MLVLGPSLTDFWNALRLGGATRETVNPAHAKLLARASEPGWMHRNAGRADPAPYRALLAEHLNPTPLQRPPTRAERG